MKYQLIHQERSGYPQRPLGQHCRIYDENRLDISRELTPRNSDRVHENNASILEKINESDIQLRESFLTQFSNSSMITKLFETDATSGMNFIGEIVFLIFCHEDHHRKLFQRLPNRIDTRFLSLISNSSYANSTIQITNKQTREQ